MQLFENMILAKELETQKSALKDFNPEIFTIPDYVKNNLKYDFFEWQQDAFENFLLQENLRTKRNLSGHNHCMFNMATGTGKTLLMAALILYYYKKGYRHFLFFVNQTNIVEKTEENFLNISHNKYLLKNNIIIDDKIVKIEKVNQFSNSENIQIKFTSIQKLHNDIYLERENNTTLSDINKLDIILLGDEAHHLNSKTKSKQPELDFDIEKTEITGKTGQSDIERSWEHTVLELILKKNNPKNKNNITSKNVLLEFTATIPDDNDILKKYKDKIVFQFPLKDFLKKGYTKQVNIVSSSFDKRQRILQALLFNWYRYKIGLKYISNFKPVILFRSKTIDESWEDFEFFKNIINSISYDDFSFLNEIELPNKDQLAIEDPYSYGKSRIIDIKRFIKENNLELDFISYIQNNFQERNLIITNSKSNKTQTEKTDEDDEKLLNNLEDKDNHITGIFTVKRLTEGWDVQNLYDIVRLYEGQNLGGSTKGKLGNASVQEIQLIGRGVRYYPFEYKDYPKLKRKFDDELENELRVLEEFYFHSDADERYIRQLKADLKKEGYIEDKKEIVKFDIKEKFKESPFWKNSKLFINKKKENPDRQKKDLSDLATYTHYDVTKEFSLEETQVSLEMEGKDKSRLEIHNNNKSTISFNFKNLKIYHRHIVYKAINNLGKADNSIWKFKNLTKELKITSIENLFDMEYLGNIRFSIATKSNNRDLDNLNNEELYEILLRFFKKIEKEINSFSKPFIGSVFESKDFKEVFKKPKEKFIDKEKYNSDDVYKYANSDWFLLDKNYSTSEESALIEFIENRLTNLGEKFDDVFLLRNEEVLKIYNFSDGQGFQPDFLLFLTKNKKILSYQIFIEAKGSQFQTELNNFEYSKEEWKQKFLLEITDYHSNHGNYRIYGLPFFSREEIVGFENHFSSLIKNI